MEVYDLSEANELDTYMSREVPVPVPEGDKARSLTQEELGQGQEDHCWFSHKSTCTTSVFLKDIKDVWFLDQASWREEHKSEYDLEKPVEGSEDPECRDHTVILYKGLSNPSSYLQIAWSRNQTYSMSLGKTLVVQVDPWLNQQWFSWPWSSSSCVRIWASSPSRTGTSLLMKVSNSFFFKEIKYFHAWNFSTSPSLSSSWCDRSLWNENLKCK